MIRPFKRYFEVAGRSSRAEYWQFLLFQGLVVVGVFAFWVGMVTLSPPGSMMIPSICLGVAYLLFLAASIVPNITVIIRRLHDTNRTAWWLCLYLPGTISVIQTIVLVVRGLNATPAEMTQMVSETINGTVLGMSTTICQLTMFVYMILPGTKDANRFGEAPIALEIAPEVAAPETPKATTDIDFDAVEAELIARRLSLSNLPRQPVRPNYRPVAVPVPVMKSFDTGPYNPGIKPAQPFGRRGAS